ncbi:hypothetical protein cypCar_00038556 [Cyprinus carpio]|nr:hypothetical protein cypCar_00038556 [Cyprinus carpio]
MPTKEQYDVVGPVDPVFAVAGEEVILPCSVKPSISVVDMRVEWFRSDLKDSQLVHLYEDHDDRNTEQSQSYRGRTKLNEQELQRGDASLKLSSVQVSDEGRYKCFIQSKSWSDDATVDVSVEGKSFNPWRTSIILSSVAVVLIVIAGILLAAFVRKTRERDELLEEKDRKQREFSSEREKLLEKEKNRIQQERDELLEEKNRIQRERDELQKEKNRKQQEQYEVVGPADTVFAVAGEDVILPCSVKPSISVVDMRVEWFRSDLKNSLVHLYEDHDDRNTEQIQSYRERTKLNHQELQRGNASLKLSSVRVSDEGRYKCFIQSKSWSGDATVDFIVEAVGSPPVITVDGFDDTGRLYLQCESEGWYPEPVLEWLDSEGVRLSSETAETHRNEDGFSVKHTVTVYETDSKIHCRVKLKHHMLETLIITSKHSQLQTENRRIKHELDELLQSQKIPKVITHLETDMGE